MTKPNFKPIEYKKVPPIDYRPQSLYRLLSPYNPSIKLSGYLNELAGTSTSSSSSIQQSDVSAYWSFDGTFLADSTGHGNTLTNNNGVTSGTGKISNGAVFNSASSQYFTAANSLQVSPSGSFSVSCWFKPNFAGSFILLTGCEDRSGDGVGWGSSYTACQMLNSTYFRHTTSTLVGTSSHRTLQIITSGTLL